MTVDFLTGAVVLAISAIACVAVRWAAEGTYAVARKSRYNDLYASFLFKVPVDFESFVESLSLVGRCYHIPAGKLRHTTGLIVIFQILIVGTCGAAGGPGTGSERTPHPAFARTVI